ncbi:MAG: MBOAT family protein [Clostridia bacterium]|nr:MBOAT family protein [Clostridia bacterium]
MVFSSAVFLLVFLPAVLLLYYTVPDCLRNPLLLAVSLIFYGWGEPVYILIMLFSTVFDYSNGLMLEWLDRRGRPEVRKWVLVLSLAGNLGMLCFFKYTDFLISSVNALTGQGFDLVGIALPIGISFYTFQTLSYTIDVYRREIQAQHSILRFGMYICMFPQLIAGPIVKYRDIEKQLGHRPIDAARVCRGIFRFTLGLGKKVLLANNCGMIWDEISAQQGNTAVTAFIGAAAYMLQIYFDFSGYSDMAIGIGKMLGFDFLENFDYPYESGSVTEFWRRWHISLGSWFREYLYIPLGGNRKGLPRQMLNLLIVWSLTGLWHGAGWNFVVWGLYFFVLLAVEKLFLLDRLKKAPAAVGHVYTLLTVLFSWVIFACDDIGAAGSYLLSLLGANGLADATTVYYFRENFFLLVIGALLSVSFARKYLSRKVNLIPDERIRFGIKAAVGAGLYVVSLLAVIGSSYNPFLYFRF